MLGLKQRFALFIVAGLAMGGVARRASATTVVTPFGPADDSCVHEIPKGGSVDVQTGDVSVNGAVVSHFGACTTSPFTLQVGSRQSASATVQSEGPELLPSGGSGAPISGGWYDWSWANATTISGLSQFDELAVDWTVPTKPTYDSSWQYLFPSLENGGGGCGSNLAIIQPVLQFGTSPFYGGNNWEIASWGVWGCNSSCQNCSQYYSTPEVVSQHDSLSGYIWQTESNLDQWEIYAEDNTSGAWSEALISNIPNSWPKFNTAQMGVFEAYDLNSSCTDLSTDNSVTFNLDWLDEGGPYWDSWNDVSPGNPNAVSWGGFHSNSSPYCGWNGTGTPTTSTTLTWVEGY